EEASARRKDGIEREGGGPFTVRERPTAYVGRFGARIPDLDELVVARGVRIHPDEEGVRLRGIGKKGGGRPWTREERFGLALRPEGGGCQDERREQGRSRTSPGTHDSVDVRRGPYGAGRQARHVQ